MWPSLSIFPYLQRLFKSRTGSILSWTRSKETEVQLNRIEQYNEILNEQTFLLQLFFKLSLIFFSNLFTIAQPWSSFSSFLSFKIFESYFELCCFLLCVLSCLTSLKSILTINLLLIVSVSRLLCYRYKWFFHWLLSSFVTFLLNLLSDINWTITCTFCDRVSIYLLKLY